MAKVTRGKADEIVKQLKDALDAYETDHPSAEAALYRYNSASIRVRVIDRRFEGMSKSRRHDAVWHYLAAKVSEDTLAEVSQVIAIPEAELGSSFANLEFENPSPSRL